jgi:hypothetical protein
VSASSLRPGREAPAKCSLVQLIDTLSALPQYGCRNIHTFTKDGKPSTRASTATRCDAAPRAVNITNFNDESRLSKHRWLFRVLNGTLLLTICSTSAGTFCCEPIGLTVMKPADLAWTAQRRRAFRTPRGGAYGRRARTKRPGASSMSITP